MMGQGYRVAGGRAMVVGLPDVPDVSGLLRLDGRAVGAVHRQLDITVEGDPERLCGAGDDSGKCECASGVEGSRCKSDASPSL